MLTLASRSVVLAAVFNLCSSSQHVHAQQSYEQQVVSLTRSVTTLEENLRQTEDEKAVLRADYTAARENAAQLDALKEQLQRKLTAMHLDKEQVPWDLLPASLLNPSLIFGQLPLVWHLHLFIS